MHLLTQLSHSVTHQNIFIMFITFGPAILVIGISFKGNNKKNDKNVCTKTPLECDPHAIHFTREPHSTLCNW